MKTLLTWLQKFVRDYLTEEVNGTYKELEEFALKLAEIRLKCL